MDGSLIFVNSGSMESSGHPARSGDCIRKNEGLPGWMGSWRLQFFNS